MIINILCSCQSSSLRILRSFFGSSRRRPYEWAQQLAAKRTRTIDQIAYENFPSKNFQAICSVRVPFKTLNKSLRRTLSCSLLCWWAQMDSNHRLSSLRDFQRKSQKRPNKFAVDVCPFVPKQNALRGEPRLLFCGGLKWTRTIDLTLIRRVL